MGTFTGTTINDSRNIKEALQDLETEIESIGTFYYSVDPTDFVLTNQKIDQELIEYAGPDGDYIFNDITGGSEDYVADLNLPHGSEIQSITVYIYNNNGDNFEFWLQEKDVSGMAAINTLANATQSMAGGFDNIVVGSILAPVNNSLYSYRIRIQMDNDNTNNRIYGAVIEYTE